jgi:predicted GH43/DUF377 family glycosyl hydrolase
MENPNKLGSLVRLDIRITGNDSRVLALPSTPGHPEALCSVIRRVEALSNGAAKNELAGVQRVFSLRHQNLPASLEEGYLNACLSLNMEPRHAEPYRSLLGAYFTMEYTLEAAALFNPSIVPHPDQSGAPPGGLRFVMSLRAVGEGHLSSTVFREGTIGANGTVSLDDAQPRAVRTRGTPDQKYLNKFFRRTLGDLGTDLGEADRILDRLGEWFSYGQLDAEIESARHRQNPPPERVLEELMALAHANYQLRLPAGSRISELVMYPQSAFEARGIEDLRLVSFTEPGGARSYYGTYTAYDGRRILPMLMQTDDFRVLEVNTLNGDCAIGKGMALFPRKIRGQYAMCSRIDGQNLFLMFSDRPTFWETAEMFAEPAAPWEYRLIGNCGSPIETPEGWLLLTHGVGPMRQYAIGAMLLDLDDPRKIRGRLREPLLVPPEALRDGYVPNVVYTCGAQLHAGRLFIPYAVADEITVMARVDLAELLARLIKNPQ